MKFIVINGPNLNMLGIREPSIYGEKSYRDLVQYVKTYADEVDVDVSIYQNNSEGALVTMIQRAYNEYDGMIINPAAFSHTSIAILDAIKSIGIPTVEVHLTDLSKREEFRQKSITSLAALTVISGFGFDGYLKAIDYLVEYLDKTPKLD